MEIVQAAFIIIILLLLIFFVFYKKIIHVAAAFITIAFFISILLSLSAIFLPQIYKSGAELLIKDSDFGLQLKNLDNSFTQVGNLPNGILDSIGNIFGQNSERESYKSDLYNQFVDFTGSVLRIDLLIFAIIIMILSVYVRYSYSGLIESEKLARKVQELEKEVNLLKEIRRV